MHLSAPSDSASRPNFRATPAVSSARRRDRYIPCPACQSTLQRYLFHHSGARYVACRACGLVYADPVGPAELLQFDLEALRDYSQPLDLRHASVDFAEIAEAISAAFERRVGRGPRSILLLGRWHREFARQVPDQIELRFAADHCGDEHQLMSRPLGDTLGDALRRSDVVLLHGFLEAVPDSARVLADLSGHLHPDALLAVTFPDMRAVASRVLRRRWKGFRDNRVAFYDPDNLSLLMWRLGFRRVASKPLRTRYSAGYVARRLALDPRMQHLLSRTGLGRLSASIPAGYRLALFKSQEPRAPDTLSIIVPVFNEAKFVASVLTSLIELELAIEHEIIVVESNSSDGSREIVSSFEGMPHLRVIYQDAPQGKGNAVREGLRVATGSIQMIQDADFEYDFDDYDALLEPILQRHASFVLGSRSLGLDDWRIRRYPRAPTQGTLLNLAQLAFASTFNLLYQQRTTDINTMFKVFRRECIDGCTFDGDGFNFDIELVCKIVRNGHSPLEVPVNYHGRGFDEGKKIGFADAWPSYYQLFRSRFGEI